MPSVSADLERYMVWALVVLAGAAIAFAEHRATGRFRLWILLVVLAIAGEVTMRLSPFTFQGGGYYMEALIVMAGSLMCLGGYAAALLCSYLGRRLNIGGIK
ncbi:MAG: hypothetical protein WC807_06165 [Hyphomicrobium sp.]|jgi:hypothetical protein